MRGKSDTGDGPVKPIAMIPARLGSQRLKKKNLCEINGEPLIVHAIRKCAASGAFSEIWVNTEAEEIGCYAEREGAGFHRRPPELANNTATSEQFVYEFLSKHPCEYVVQVHSIAPLLTAGEIQAFVSFLDERKPDVLLSVIEENLECLFDGRPVNFTFAKKENSQDLKPVQRICWSITAWRRATYMSVFEQGRAATYAGTLDVFPVSRMAGHVIKTEKDLQLARAVLSMR